MLQLALTLKRAMVNALIRTFRYPLRPTAAQEATLDAWRRQCCDLYNAALQERRDAWKKQRVSIGYNAQTKSLTEWRAMDPDGAAVPAWVQRSALRRVDLAFKAFFRRVKVGQTPGFPRFKSKKRYDSFSVPAHLAPIRAGRVQLQRGLAVKFHQYRPLRGKVLVATVSRDATGKWWVCFACHIGAAPEKVAPVSIVGIDVGLKSLAVTSDGEVVENPRHTAKAAAKLARAQRVAARRKRGSESRKRAVALVARHHARVRNQRLDHARKVAAALVSRYDVIAREDLNIAGLGRSALSGHIQNAGWGILLHAIACKAEEAGKHVVAVDPRHTSQTCSGCGVLVPKDLSVRVHDCPHCGLRMDRDHNAARNVMARGRRAVPWPEAFDPVQARSGLEAA